MKIKRFKSRIVRGFDPLDDFLFTENHKVIFLNTKISDFRYFLGLWRVLVVSGSCWV